MPDHTYTIGSSQPTITDDLWGNGARLNLTGATVTVDISKYGLAFVTDSPATIVDAPNGRVAWAPQSTDLTETGIFEMYWKIAWPGGLGDQTVPSVRPRTLEVLGLGSGSPPPPPPGYIPPVENIYHLPTAIAATATDSPAYGPPDAPSLTVTIPAATLAASGDVLALEISGLVQNNANSGGGAVIAVLDDGTSFATVVFAAQGINLAATALGAWMSTGVFTRVGDVVEVKTTGGAVDTTTSTFGASFGAGTYPVDTATLDPTLPWTLNVWGYDPATGGPATPSQIRTLSLWLYRV